MLEKSLDARPQSMEEVIGVLEAGGVGSGGYAAVAPMAAGPSAPTIAAARPTTLGGAAGQLATAPVRTPRGSLVPLVIMGVVVVAAVAGVVVYMKKGKDSGAQPSPTATVTASPSPSPSQSPSPVLDPRSKEIEDTLASARRALAEEHWAGAIASAEVVLKLDPDNQEAQDIRERAKKAERNHVIYQEFRDAVQAKKHAEAVLLYGKLAGSAFEDEAAPELEKLRDDFLAPFVASAKKHLAAKKCSDIARDAAKVEKVVPEWRKVIDDIGKGCTTLKPSASPSPSPTPSASAAAGAAPAAAKRDPNDLIPPKAPVQDSDCEAGVQAAQEDYVHGNYAGAIEKARKAARGTCVARAWRLIGASSCFLKDKSGAVAAWNRLPNTDRKFLEYVCARNGIEMP